MLVVPVTINAKMRLAHELLSSPEPHILKWLGYIIKSINSLCFYYIIDLLIFSRVLIKSHSNQGK
ncbi:hypothetical protein [Pseudoalteromonas sp. NBT06-2]|uniref:hypothetical protein n=1 Tax=Pseudoalteromonas sp. NBT06-2 TaxID=2025950 RepID=UPI001140BDB0|nr:hypothetical protein [Pseudoalteromonas sp. NBT06-2]